MSVRSKLAAIGAALAVAVGPLAFPAIASATPVVAPPQPNLYATNINNGSTSSRADQFATYNGVTYFTASTTDHGRAIFSVSSPGQTPTFVTSVETAGNDGRMTMSLFVHSHYLFFVDNVTGKDNDGPIAQVYDLDAHSAVSLSGITSNTGTWSNMTDFANIGDDVYFFTADDNNHSWLNVFNTATGTASTVNNMPFYASAPVASRNANGRNLGGLFEFAGKIWVRTSSETWRAYNPADQTWSDPVSKASGGYITGPYMGTFQYNDSQVAVFANTGWRTGYSYLKTDGTVATLGAAYSTSTNANFLFNFNGNLYIYNLQDTPELDRINNDGTITNVSSTLFPGHDSMTIVNETEVNGYAVFAGGTSGQQFWKWDGTNAAQQIGTFSSDASWGSVYDNPTPFITADNFSIATVGNDFFTPYYMDVNVGLEPYYFTLDGTATLAANLDDHKDGGSMQQCNDHYNSGGSDYVITNLNTNLGKAAQPGVAKFDQVNGKMQYSTYVIPSAVTGNWPAYCGFVTIGNYAYFWSMSSSGSQADGYLGVYRINLTSGDVGLVWMGTSLGFFDWTYPHAFTNGRDYFFTSSDGAIHKIDGATGAHSIVVGSGAQGGAATYADPWTTPLVVDGTLYFAGHSGSQAQDVFSLNLNDPTAVSVNLTQGRYSQYSIWYAQGFMAWNGKVVFHANEDDQTVPHFYSFDPSTGLISNLAQPEIQSGVGGYVEDSFVVGNSFYAVVDNYQNTGGSRDVYQWTDSSTVSKMNLDVPVQCIARAGNYLAVEDTDVYTNGNIYFYDASGNRASELDGVDYTNTFCNSAFGDGALVMVQKYKGNNWYQNEVGFVGDLPPVAVSRFGQPVTEAPSNPYGPNGTIVDTTAPGVPTEVTASTGDGTIDVVWNAPTDGGTARDYEVTSSPAGLTCNVVSNSAKCSGFPSDGITYTFTVKAKNPAGTSAASTSSNGAKSPITASTPTIGGNVRLTQTVSAQTPGWSAGVSYAYQWIKDGVDISGATGSTYRIANGDLGHNISVRVTGSKSGLPSRTFTSRAQTVGTAVVTLYGSPRIDNTLSVDPGIWPAGYTLSYQWRANNSPISGATGTTFKITANETLSRITVLITGTKTGARTITKVSPSSGQVPLGRLTLTPTPQVSGDPHVDGYLCADSGVWDDNVNITYQWYRNGFAIPGETSSCYYPVAGDLSQRIAVKVAGTKFGYVPVIKTSAATRIDYNTFSGLWDPYVYGTAQVGETLNVDTGNYYWWGATASIQWLANGVPIRGATDTSLTLTSKLKNKVISVRMTVSLPYYRPAKLTSNSTDPVLP